MADKGSRGQEKTQTFFEENIKKILKFLHIETLNHFYIRHDRNKAFPYVMHSAQTQRELRTYKYRAFVLNQSLSDFAQFHSVR